MEKKEFSLFAWFLGKRLHIYVSLQSRRLFFSTTLLFLGFCELKRKI
jgi:hypothetical protein